LWLAEVFGGPAGYREERGDYAQMAAAHAGLSVTDEQRARWVGLAVQAAQEAGLPTDPAFAAAFTSYLEWGSRMATAQSQPGLSLDGPVLGSTVLGSTRQPHDAPMPHWDWGPAGPPDIPAVTPQADQDDQPVALPGPGAAVSYAAHIKPLFRAHDRQSMTFVFDLWSYDDVKAHAAEILERLANGSMPCDGAWTDDKVQVFERWTHAGMLP
jgi:hypothetical protein